MRKPFPPTAKPSVVGKTAILRSGGPTMTIVNEDNNGLCECKWHNDEGKVEVHNFPITVLDMTDPPEGPVGE